MKKKRISLLGSTGSIGTQTLETVRENPDKLCIAALAAKSNSGAVFKQMQEFKPEIVCMYDESSALELSKSVCDSGSEELKKIEIVSGMDGLISCACLSSADICLSAVVGMIGILPVIAAIKSGKDIAFANKETLVTAGHIIMPLVCKHGVRLLPVDSEHSAIFQALQTLPEYADSYINRKATLAKYRGLSKIILTASGGPFFGMKKEELVNIKPEAALKHPNWKMGKKITIDSATMVNKGLEVMEACHLFNVTPGDIEVLIQRESIVHSAVEFEDGAIIAQLGTPDMKLPIQYALFYPEREFLKGKRLSLADIGSISFKKPDNENFKGLKLAITAMNEGGSLPIVFNAANEEAVSLYLSGKIGFLDICDTIEKIMNSHKKINSPGLDEIFEIEKEARQKVHELN
jgi:1-deoxy-D-xylulose-5-phosphate reductoisomerase